jgi:hypothetical protein
MQSLSDFQVKTIFGFGVWHEPFDSKAKWGWISYFDIRNALIGGSIHGASFFSSYKKVIQTLCITAISNRYQANSAICAGVEDFLQGIKTLDGSQRTRAVTAYGKNINVPEDSFDTPIISLQNIPIKNQLITLLGHFLRTFSSLEPKKIYAETSQELGATRAIAKTHSTIVYSPYGDIAEFLYWNRAKSQFTYFKSLKIILIFPFKWLKARKHWKNNFTELILSENWQSRWQGNR